MTGRAETGLFLEGLRCAGCVRTLERELRSLPGVLSASVSLARERALVCFDPAQLGVPALVERVAALGFTAAAYDPDALERPSGEAARRALVRLLIAGFLAANSMSLSLALYFGVDAGIDADLRLGLRLLTIAFALPSVVWCAAPFWRGAVSDLRRGRIGMDVPVALGIGTAFAASILGTGVGARQVFTDSAPAMVFVILLGRTLERMARGRAAHTLERLLAAVPPRALRRSASGVEEVAASELRVGDRVVVPPGSVCAADGCIVLGTSELDESLLSGEAAPVARGPGDAVSGGMRNLAREIEVQVTAPAASGRIARLACLLERSQLARPALQRSADRAAGYFAPAVLLAASVTGLAWWWLGRSALDAGLVAAAVLIVACPCALSLATPIAVVTAIGRAARLGIVVKSGEALERCARSDVVLLDKTGTLTEGRFALRQAVPAHGVTAGELLRCAAAVEGSSTHPIAEAIRRAGREQGVAADELEARRAVAGQGVLAGDGSVRLAVGSERLLAAEGVCVPPDLAASAARAAKLGQTQVFVARGARVLGVLCFEDVVRADAALAVARLHRLGIRTALVTGDHAHAAALAAAHAQIGDVVSDVTPEGKVERVIAERRRGRCVLMAGDGINDAAALAAADVGIAFARGSDAALHAADLVATAPRLGAVPDAIELARATLRSIRQGLGLAVAYNAVAVPLAALGVLQPLSAAIAMSVSSLLVTANAIRLARWEPRA